MSHDVLRRMVSPPPPAPEDVPITSSRAMRLAVTRAADKTHNLPLTVTSLEEEVLDLDAMLATLGPELLLVGMVDEMTLVGLSAFDAGLRSALIEVQTVGAVLAVVEDDRPPTGTDAAMMGPMLLAILAHLAETAPRTPLDGWGQGLHPSQQVPSTRAAGLILPERRYRVMRMTLDLQVEGREGRLVMALPDQTVSPPVTVEAPIDEDWTTRFQAAVNAAPVRLKAELHRFKAPLYAVEDLSVGQVIPLTGCTVTSVKLHAADGRKVATARLGQSGGMRAVRVEQADLPGMHDIADLGGGGATGLPPMGQEQAMSLDLDVGGKEDGMALDFSSADGFAAPDAAMSIDMDAAGDAAAADETTRMLDEMEAAIAMDGDGETDEEDTGELDWSGEFDVSAVPDAGG